MTPNYELTPRELGKLALVVLAYAVGCVVTIALAVAVRMVL